MEPEYTNNPIKEIITLSSKCFSYICKNDIENNKNKLKNNIVHWFRTLKTLLRSTEISKTSTFIGQTGIFSTSSAVCFFIVANIIYS